jgi:FSR family fosmidomycin resistance protein-like MFS transporter
MTTTVKTEGPVGNSEPRGRGHGRRVLAACGLAHFAHDGFSDTIYLLLPVWAENFGLSHAEVGILKTVFSGSLASSQLPAGLLAERWGARWVLVISTLVVGASFMALGLAGGFIGLAALLCCAGVASGAQHTLSSTLVAEAYRDGRLRAALGTYNFTGDLGKVAAPVLMAGGIALMGWRASSLALGAFGCVVGIGLFIALKRLGTGDAPRGKSALTRGFRFGDWGVADRSGFRLLAAIGMLDGAVRIGFLTFLPFLLIAKGAGVETVGLALALTLGGGAAGKLACGFLAERIGVIRTVVLTELATGAGILALLAVPLAGALMLLPLVGLALNGTSSALYGTVPEFAAPGRQSRIFGLFYTLTIGASAIAPVLCGLLSDLAGVPVTLAVVAMAALAPIPLCPLLARSIR